MQNRVLFEEWKPKLRRKAIFSSWLASPHKVTNAIFELTDARETIYALHLQNGVTLCRMLEESAGFETISCILETLVCPLLREALFLLRKDRSSAGVRGALRFRVGSNNWRSSCYSTYIRNNTYM